MASSRREPGGFSLVEVLLVLGMLVVALVPILTMFGSSRRIAHSAGRLADVTLHAQEIIEALSVLQFEEFPPVQLQSGTGPSQTGTVLMADEVGAESGGGTRFAEVVAFFKKPPPVKMDRVVSAVRLPTKELLLRIRVTWDAVVGEKRTEQTITLSMLATPRNWQ